MNWNWQILSLLSMLCFGAIGILMGTMPERHLGFQIVFFYGLSAATAAAIASTFWHGHLITELTRQTALVTVGMGILLCIGMSAQVIAMQKAHEQYPWVMLIGSCCPVVIIAYATWQRPATLNVYNTFGLALIMAGLFFIFKYTRMEAAAPTQVQSVEEVANHTD